MALTINSSYAGEAASEYLKAALLSGNTLANEAITIKSNIKFKEALRFGSLSDNILQSDSCDWTEQGDITLSEKSLEPSPYKVNVKFCKSALRSDWDALSMGASANDNLPSNFSDFIIASVAESVADALEKKVWTASVAGGDQFDGLETQLKADGDVIATTLAAAIDASNVISVLQGVVLDIPKTIYGKSDLSLYVSADVAKYYIAAQAALGYANLYHDGQTPMNFQGINIIVVEGMSASTIIAARKSNLFFGTGLLNDTNDVKVIDMSDSGEDNIRVVLRFTAGVAFGFGSEVVLASL